METRKNNKRFRKTRSKKQKGGSDKLITASRDGHIHIVEELLKNGTTDVNETNELGTTSLIMASWRGHIKIVQMLLDNGADVNVKDKLEKTALGTALDHGHKEIALKLLNNGADVNMTSSKRMNTPLIIAIQNGHNEIAKELLTKKGIDVNAKNNWGETALMKASQCDPDFLDKNYEHHKNEINEQIELIKLLIKKGADFHMKNGQDLKNDNDENSGKTALDYAKETNFVEMACPEIVKLLEDYNQRHEDRKNLAVIEKAASENKTEMPPLMEKFFKMNKGQRTDLNQYLGGKQKKLKGGAQERLPVNVYRPPVNVYNMVDELIELGHKRNMRNTRDHNRLQKKYEEIMRKIDENTNENDLKEVVKNDLKEVFVEIHHVMFQPNRGGIIPIDLYHESLRTKLQAIKNKICNNHFIDCPILESDPDSIHFGGKRKTNKSKKPKRKTRKIHRK